MSVAVNMPSSTERKPATGSARRLVVGIPALDEARTIGDVIEGIPREIPGVDVIEVVVIDDGSADDTGLRAGQNGAQVIRHEKTLGVGAAFQSGLAYAIKRDAELYVSIDADGQFDPGMIPKLIEPVLNNRADFATASRFADPSLTPQMPWIKRWGNRMMSRLISRLAGHTYHDVSCGMRCYNRRAALSLNLLGRFTYTQEVFLNLAFKHLRIVEVPLPVRGVREHGRSRVARNLGAYAFKTCRIILRCYRDYHPLRFFGGLVALTMIPAAGLATFLLVHYLTTGSFSPHKWAGFVAAGLTLIGLIFLHIGIIGDMLNRHRIYLEELLYYGRGGRNVEDHSDE